MGGHYKGGDEGIAAGEVWICLVNYDVFRVYLMIARVGLWGLVMCLTTFLKFYATIIDLHRIKFQ